MLNGLLALAVLAIIAINKAASHVHSAGERIPVPLGRRLANVLSSPQRTAHPQAARRFEVEADDDSPGGATLIVEEVQRMAVTSETTYSFHESRQFDEKHITNLSLLASNPKEVEGLTILSVNKATGDVRGLRRGRTGDAHTIFTNRDDGHRKLQMRRTSGEMPEKDWTCGAAHAHDDYYHEHTRSSEGHLFQNSEVMQDSTKNGARSGPASTVGKPGEWVSPTKYSFYVDISFDIDKAFIEKQGSAEAAVEYINVLISAANMVFESEVDAHLNVVSITETDIYDDLETAREALRTMRLTPRPNTADGGSKIILHHALLGRYLGGGIAFIDSVCDDMWAYGVTSDLSGSVTEMDDLTLFDFFIVTHEIGHSLGSGHTFDAYDPPVDGCGVCTIKPLSEEAANLETGPNGKVAVAGLPEDNAATLMSYCNFCEGGMGNVALTLGGMWDGISPRSDLSHWENHPDLAGAVSVEPRRVAHNVWERLASKGECVRPPSDPSPVQGCNDDADCNDNNPCTTDYCDESGHCAIAKTLDFCCGNGKCEAGEGQTCAPDCGLFHIKAPTFCEGEDCHAFDGFMVDVGLSDNANRRIFITSMSLMYASPVNDDDDQATIDVYVTTGGSYVRREQSPDAWTKVGSATFPRYNPKKGPQFIEIDLDRAIPLNIGGRRGFYFHSTEQNIMFGNGVYSTRNEHEVELHSSRAVSGLFGEGIDGFSLNVEVGYLLEDKPPPQPVVRETEPAKPELPMNQMSSALPAGELDITLGDKVPHEEYLPASEEVPFERPEGLSSENEQTEHIAEEADQSSSSSIRTVHPMNALVSLPCAFLLLRFAR
ncbi:hypothetical protein ACHAXT_011905 [Thalassiosira profunda]